MKEGPTARAIALLRPLCATIGYRLSLLLLTATCLTPFAFGVDPDTESATAKKDEKTAPGEVKSPPASIVNLLAAPLNENWQVFNATESQEGTEPWKIIKRNDVRVLCCTGTPKGFLFTREEYSDFELEFEWRYPNDENGNSGILVFTQQEPRLWPTSMQVQLHQPKAGSVFPGGDAKSDNSTNANGLALKVGEWNKCRIVVLDGKVSVQINGTAAGEVDGCQPQIGRIAIQSEGSLTEFRNMKLTTPATASSSKPKSAKEVSEGEELRLNPKQQTTETNKAKVDNKKPDASDGL